MAMSPPGTDRWLRFREGLVAYTLGLMGGPTEAPLQAGGTPTLMSLCFAVCLLDLLGAAQETASETADFIRSCQGPDSLFRDPGVDPARIRGFDHEYVSWQLSAFCLSALDSLGAEPQTRPVYFERFEDADILADWLRGLPWNRAWYISNKVMFVLNGLQWLRDRHEEPDRARLQAALDAGFATLDTLQDSRTGYWGTREGSNLFIGMGGAFHILIPYYYDRRPIQYAEAIVDSTLRLQTSEGLFRVTGGGACDDLDAVDMLVKLGRGPRVERALRACLGRLLETQLPDGGFPWYERRSGLGPLLAEAVTMAGIGGRADLGTAYRWLRTWGQRRFLYPKGRVFRYSGIHEMPYHPQRSDLWSSWFRAVTILLAADAVGIDLPFPVRFKSAPGLTFHRPRAGRSAP